MAFAPVLTSFVDADPMPRVEVLFNSFHAATARVTVYRLAEGRQYKVRSAVNAATAGALSRVDLEVPFGIPAAYRAEMFDADGMSLGFTDTATVTLDVKETWVHNPLNPSGGVRVRMHTNAARALSRPVEGSAFYPKGRRVAVVISGQRRGLSNVLLDCVTLTDEDTDKFADLVGTYSEETVPVLCYRIAADMNMRLPRPLFAAVLDPVEVPINLHAGGSAVRWEAAGNEAAPPAPALVVPLLTRADLNAFYSTRAALNADNLTRLAVNRRYDLGGTA